jgi:hypothetical protein
MGMLAIGSRGPYPYHEGRYLLVALREFVYCDESGIHAEAPFCLVAGYRGSPRQWSRFNKEWRAITTSPRYKPAEGYPRKEIIFHSNVFFNRKRIKNPRENPFLGWKDEQAAAFINDLLAVIQRRNIWPVGCVVNVRDFETLSYGERCALVNYFPTKSSFRPGRERPHPYHLAFRLMVEDAMENSDPSTKFEFTLGESKEVQQHAFESYALMKEYGVDGLGTQLDTRLAFDTPANLPALQAADLFAHQWYGFLSIQIDAGSHLSSERTRAMAQLTHKRNDMPDIGARAFEHLFLLLGYTKEKRAFLKSILPPSGA